MQKRKYQITTKYQDANEDPFNFACKKYSDMRKYGAHRDEETSIKEIHRMLHPEIKPMLKIDGYSDINKFLLAVKQARDQHVQDKERLENERKEFKKPFVKRDFGQNRPFHKRFEVVKGGLEEKAIREAKKPWVDWAKREKDDKSIPKKKEPEKKKSFTCFRCGGPDHYANKCTRPPSKEYNAEIRSMFAHMAIKPTDVSYDLFYENETSEEGENEESSENEIELPSNEKGVAVGEDTPLNSTVACEVRKSSN